MPDTNRPASRALRLLPLGMLVAIGILFLAVGGRNYLTLSSLAENRQWLCAVVRRSEGLAIPAFIVVYAGLTALSVPAAAVMTLAAGFLFGTWLGLFNAVVGATLGATAVFLAARAGLAGLTERAGPRFRRLEEGLRADALNYLLVLRLVPIFPFWLVNLVAGIVGMRLTPYVLATFFGIIPASFVYASLGNELSDIIAQGRTPDLGILCRASVLLPLIGLAALVLLPVLYKRWRARQDKRPA
jgi:uncharacterized membrane protein YdjX (TVP38/TMEM64 family)